MGYIYVDIFNGFNDHKQLLESSGLDVMALSEIWISHEYFSGAFNILNYSFNSLIQKKRLGRGEGVTIYVGTQY